MLSSKNGGGNMLQYMSTNEAAEKWGISRRRVSVLCAENRIPNVAMLGNMWIIPRNADKPLDAREKRNNAHTNNDRVHPFVKWVGGKGQHVDVLRQNLPYNFPFAIKKYAEPFVGGGALLFSLLNDYSFEEVFVCDNNRELINVFLMIKDNCNSLVCELSKMQKEYNDLSVEEQEKYYYCQREKFNKIELSDESAIEKAALFVFLNKTCFNGLYRVNKSGKFNVPAGKYKNPLICDEKNLLRISSKLQNVTIKTCDYHDVENFADNKTLVYFDPPYRPLNKTSAFTSYTEEQFDDDDQKELALFAKRLSAKGVKIMLNNSDPRNTNENDDFFDKLYDGFDIQRITATRMINSKGDKRGSVKELLIKNY